MRLECAVSLLSDNWAVDNRSLTNSGLKQRMPRRTLRLDEDQGQPQVNLLQIPRNSPYPILFRDQLTRGYRCVDGYLGQGGVWGEKKTLARFLTKPVL